MGGGRGDTRDLVLTLRLISPANGYEVDLEKQHVVVYGPDLPPFETITEKIAKTGKEILAKQEIPAGEPIPAA